MPVETATYINGLDPASPGGTDQIRDADDHLRLIKAVLKATFPNLNAPVTATPTQLNSAVPIGSMVVWPFSVETVPVGWHLCDGSTVSRSDGQGTITTPNMFQKFVMGCTQTNDVGGTGGALTATGTTSTSGAHSHNGATSVAGAHNHGGFTGLSAGGAQGNTSGSSYNSISQDGDHAHTYTTSLNGDHTHTVTVSTLPPYVAFPWIMKV